MAAMRSLVTFPLCLLLGTLAWSSRAGAQPAYITADDPRDQVDLHAVLDPGAHRIAGTLRWRFTNRSEVPVTELYWHLYLNAFRREGSVFTREGGTEIRHRQVGAEGGITLTALRLADGRDLLARSTLDVGVPDDQTQLHTALFEPLLPGATLDLRVTFVSQLPAAVARSGFVGDFHAAAQWFPKLARLEADGTWAHFPYHGLGEFYADFADYTLTVVAPADMEVVAGGAPVGAEASGQELRAHRFAAHAVHDMVFIAARDLRVIEGRQPLTTHSVLVRVVHPPGFERVAADHLALTRRGLAYFSRLFGEYPYPVLTVVVPPHAAEAVSGMEYPTLFLTSGPWWGSGRPLLGAGAAETTAHELAHQWFQGLVATNEVRYPALDEGLTSWATGALLRELHGSASGARVGRVSLDGFELDRSWALSHRVAPAPLSPVHAFETEAYYRTIYVYVPLVLETIARAWGRERLLRALGSYARTQRFAHPSPDALREAFRAEYGAWFVREVLDPALTRGCTAHTQLGELATACDDSGCRTELVAQRSGCLPVPLEVAVETDGGVTLHHWAGSARELRLRVDPSTRMRVEVDPRRRNLTDPRRLDDVRVFGEGGPSPSTVEGVSLLTRLLGVFQLAFSLAGP
jgi:hypothetical protein